MKQYPHIIRALLFTCLAGSLSLWSAAWMDGIHATPNSIESQPLPASLYVLTTEHEVVRLHQNGQFAGQLTNEFEQIEDFDVSPVHGRLVYTLGNRLIELDPYSGERVVKFDAILHNRGWISSPRYSPDGRQITFIMQGTLWSTSSSTKEESAFHRLVPTAAAEQIALSELFDASWSPNGEMLLLIERPDAMRNDFRYLMLDLATDALTVVGNSWPDAQGCCTITWGEDGRFATITSFRVTSDDQRVLPPLAHTVIVSKAGTYEPLQALLPPCTDHPHYATGCQILSLLPNADGTAIALQQDAEAELRTNLLYIGTDESPTVLSPPIEMAGDLLLWQAVGQGIVVQHDSLLWYGIDVDKNATSSLHPPLDLMIKGNALRWGPINDPIAQFTAGAPIAILPDPPLQPGNGITPTTSLPSPPLSTSMVFTQPHLLAEHTLSVTLPAPLYFINSDGQIARLRRGEEPNRYVEESLVDGIIPIVDFDVSSIHGRIIYVADNQLIEVDPATGAWVVKVPAPSAETRSVTEANLDDWEYRIDTARYSPDGDTIAYTQGGINLIASGLVTDALPTLIISNVYHGMQPATSSTHATSSAQWSTNIEDLRFYSEIAWSPDGRRLLLGAGQWEGSVYEIYDLETAEMTPYLQSVVTELPLSWGWQWGYDGKRGYVASDGHMRGHPVDVETGLSAVDVESGVVTLLDVDTYTAMLRTDRSFPRSVSALHELSNRELLFFMDISTRMDWMELNHHLVLMHRAVDGTLTQEIATTFHQEGEILWATDGSGAILVQDAWRDPNESDLRAYYPTGSLYWLARDDQSFTNLQIVGQYLRWGPETVIRGATSESFISATERQTVPIDWIAYTRDRALYITGTGTETSPLLIEDCREEQCGLSALQWSPDGQLLAYAHHFFEEEWQTEVRIVDRNGVHQTTVPSQTDSFVWSPDGDQIATVRREQAMTVDGHYEDAYSEIARYAIFPVDTPPQQLKSTRLDDLFTCESYGENSASESLYRWQLQDSFPYAITHIYDWLENDILLFWVGCGATVKRFDLTTNRLLVADPLDLQQITVDPTRRCWVARGQDNTYLGATDLNAFTELALPSNSDLIAWGNSPDHLLYTVRRDMGGENFGELAHRNEAGFAYIGNIPVNLHYYETELWRYSLSESISTTQTTSSALPTATVSATVSATVPVTVPVTVSAQDRLLTQSFDYGYTSIHETESGDLFFLAVENDTRLADAIRDGVAPEELQAYRPTSHLMRLPAGETVAERWIENVQHVAIYSNTATPCHLSQIEQIEHLNSAPTAVLVPTSTPTVQPITNTPQAVPTPTITAVPTGASVLPAALYFLDTRDQIMRLAADGVTLRQITNEASPITDFAVDPLGSYLLYLSDNKLIRADSDGGNRVLILDGGAIGDVGTALYARNRIQGFSIAPDGKRLALSRYGIYLIEDITAPEPLAAMQLIVPNVPAMPRAQSPIFDKHYGISHSSWSPDGTKLLLSGAVPGDSFFDVLFDLQSGQLSELIVPTAEQEHERSLQLNMLCYTPVLGGITWLGDGSEFLIANDVYGMYGPPGLSAVSVVDGTVRPLFYAYIACHPDVLEIREETMRFFRGVHEANNGELWGFVNPSYDPTVPAILPLQMTQIDPRSGKLTPMRDDVHYLSHQILWADDDSGAMVTVRQRKGDMLDETTGELTWLPSDGTPAVNFNLDGQWMQWARVRPIFGGLQKRTKFSVRRNPPNVVRTQWARLLDK